MEIVAQLMMSRIQTIAKQVSRIYYSMLVSAPQQMSGSGDEASSWLSANVTGDSVPEGAHHSAYLAEWCVPRVPHDAIRWAARRLILASTSVLMNPCSAVRK